MREQNRRCFKEGGVDVERGSKARGFVEKYNWDDVVEEFEGVLEALI